MGDPMWRLQTSINFLAEQVSLLRREKDVEILVTDWGSRKPVSHAVQLSSTAARLTKFIAVSEELAENYNDDSPFAEVYPINVAARRANGLFIARIDQDTLVTKDFLCHFFEHADGSKPALFDITKSMLFAARRQIPKHYIETKSPLSKIDGFIKSFGKYSPPEETSPFYAAAVGIILAHRDIWNKVGGYDERLIYYWWMDIDFSVRVKSIYSVIDIGRAWGHDFYHLEHYQFMGRQKKPRRLNSIWAKSDTPRPINPNNSSWGLSDHSFAINQYTNPDDAPSNTPDHKSSFLLHDIAWILSHIAISCARKIFRSPWALVRSKL